MTLLAMAACDQASSPGLPDLPSDQRNANAKRGADAVATASVAKNYLAVVDATFPDIVKLMGGREKAAAEISRSLAYMAEDEIDLSSCTMGNVEQETKAGDRFYAVLDGDMRLDSRRGLLSKKIQTLGISDDGGRSWSYVSCSNPSFIRGFSPNLPKSIKLRDPEAAKPVNVKWSWKW